MKNEPTSNSKPQTSPFILLFRLNRLLKQRPLKQIDISAAGAEGWFEGAAGVFDQAEHEDPCRDLRFPERHRPDD